MCEIRVLVVFAEFVCLCTGVCKGLLLGFLVKLYSIGLGVILI